MLKSKHRAAAPIIVRSAQRRISAIYTESAPHPFFSKRSIGYAEARREGRPTRAPIDAGDPVGYTARIADPDGHSLELSFGQEVGLTLEAATKG